MSAGMLECVHCHESMRANARESARSRKEKVS